MNKSYIYGSRPLVNIRNNTKQGFPASIGRIGRSGWNNLNASKSVRRVPPPANLPSLKSQREPAVLKESDVGKSVPPTKWRMKEPVNASVVENNLTRRSPWNLTASTEERSEAPTIADFPKLNSSGKSVVSENRSTISSTTENLSLWRDESTVRCTVDRSLPLKTLSKPSAAISPRSTFLDTKSLNSYDNWSNAPTTIDYNEKIVFSDEEDQCNENTTDENVATENVQSKSVNEEDDVSVVSNENKQATCCMDWFTTENPSEKLKSSPIKAVSSEKKAHVFDEEEMWNQRLSDNIMKESIERAKQKLRMAEEREMVRKQKRQQLGSSSNDGNGNCVEASSQEFIVDDVYKIEDESCKSTERIDYFDDPLIIDNGMAQLSLQDNETHHPDHHDEQHHVHFEKDVSAAAQVRSSTSSSSAAVLPTPANELLKKAPSLQQQQPPSASQPQLRSELPPSTELNQRNEMAAAAYCNKIDNATKSLPPPSLVNEVPLNESFSAASKHQQQAILCGVHSTASNSSSSSNCDFYSQHHEIQSTNKQAINDFSTTVSSSPHHQILKNGVVTNNSCQMLNANTLASFPKPFAGQVSATDFYQAVNQQQQQHNAGLSFNSKNCKMVRPSSHEIDSNNNNLKLNAAAIAAAESFANFNHANALQFPRKTNDNIYCQLNQQVYLNPLPQHYPESLGTSYDMSSPYSNQCFVKDPNRFPQVNYFDFQPTNLPDEYGGIENRRIHQYAKPNYSNSPYFQGNINCMNERFSSHPANRPCPIDNSATKYLSSPFAAAAASAWNLSPRRSLVNFSAQPSIIFGDTRGTTEAVLRGNESLMSCSAGLPIMHSYPHHPNVNKQPVMTNSNAFVFPSSNNKTTVQFINKPFEEEQRNHHAFNLNETSIKEEKSNSVRGKYEMFRGGDSSTVGGSGAAEKCSSTAGAVASSAAGTLAKSESVESFLDDDSSRHSSLDFSNDNVVMNDEKEIKTVVFMPSCRNSKSRSMRGVKANKNDYATAPSSSSHSFTHSSSRTSQKSKDNSKKMSEKKGTKRSDNKGHSRSGVSREQNNTPDFVNSAAHSDESIDREEDRRNSALNKQSNNLRRNQGKNRRLPRGEKHHGNLDSNSKKRTREMHSRRSHDWCNGEDRVDQWSYVYDDQYKRQTSGRNYRRQRENNKTGGTFWNSNRHVNQRNSAYQNDIHKTSERSSAQRTKPPKSRRNIREWETESEFSHVSGHHDSGIVRNIDCYPCNDFEKKQPRKRNQAEHSKNYWLNREKESAEMSQRTSACLPPRLAKKKNTEKQQHREERRENTSEKNSEGDTLKHVEKWDNCMADGYQKENTKHEKKTSPDEYLSSAKSYNETGNKLPKGGHIDENSKNMCSEYDEYDGCSNQCDSHRENSIDAKLDSVKVLWSNEENKSQTSTTHNRVPAAVTFDSNSSKAEQKNICTVKPTQPVYPLISETATTHQDLSTSYPVPNSNAWDTTSANNRFQYNHTNGLTAAVAAAAAAQQQHFAFPSSSNVAYQSTATAGAGYGYYQQQQQQQQSGSGGVGGITSSVPPQAAFQNNIHLQSNQILAAATPLQPFFHVDNNLITHRTASSTDPFFNHSQSLNAIQLNAEPLYQQQQPNYSSHALPHHVGNQQRETMAPQPAPSATAHDFPFGSACPVDDVYTQNLNMTTHPLAAAGAAPQKLLFFSGVVHGGSAQQKPFKASSSPSAAAVSFNSHFPTTAAGRQQQQRNHSIPSSKIDFHEQTGGTSETSVKE